MLAVKLAWFVGLRACRGWRRSVAFYDLVVLLRTATGGLLTAAMIQYLFSPLPAIPRSVLLLDWGATVVVIGGARALLRGVRETRWRPFSSAGQVRVLIAGASELGASTLRMIRRLGQPRYRVVGFIDDNPSLQGTRVEGVPVVGDCQHARQLVTRYGAGQVLVMQGELAGSQVRRLLDDARGLCEVRVLPDYRQLLEGSVTVQPRPVSIEDLLQREPVRLDIEDIRHWIDGRVILVTGMPAASARRFAASCSASIPSGSWRWTGRRPASSSWSGSCSPWPPAEKSAGRNHVPVQRLQSPRVATRGLPPPSRSRSAWPTCSTGGTCAAF